MSKQEYIDSQLNFFDKAKGQIFWITGLELAISIAYSFIAVLDMVPRVLIGIFLVLFPISIWANITLVRKVKTLGQYWEDHINPDNPWNFKK